MSRSRYDAYEIVEMDRRDIKGHPFNPRIITDEARRRLKANVKRVGLLHPMNYNKRTGRLFGGHQRLAALDAIHGKPDYKVRLAVVDLSEKEEAAQLVFLNNELTQGEWDLEKLAGVLKESGTEAAGFDTFDTYNIFGADPAQAASEDEAAHFQKLADQLHELRDNHSAAFKKRVTDLNTQGYYCIVVFKDAAECIAWKESIGLPVKRFIIDGRKLATLTDGRKMPEVEENDPGEPAPVQT